MLVPARDAALADPRSRTCSRCAAPGATILLARARLLPRRRERRGARRLRGRARASTRSASRTRSPRGGASETADSDPRSRGCPDDVRPIAPVYDAMNRLMTGGLDLRWRRLAASEVVRPGDRVLDAACGTGDFALPTSRGRARGDGARLLSRGCWSAHGGRRPACGFVEGDMLALPFDDGFLRRRDRRFRRSERLSTSSSALARAPTRPAARREARDPRDYACLGAHFGPFFTLWFERLVPVLGSASSRRGWAYSYLPASVASVPGRRGARGAARARRVLRGAASGCWAGLIVALHTGRASGVGSPEPERVS